MYKPGRHLGLESSEMLSVSDRNGGSRTPRELVNLLHRKIKSVFCVNSTDTFTAYDGSHPLQHRGKGWGALCRHKYDGITIIDARKMLPRPGILQMVQHCQSTMCPGAYKENGGQAANLRAGVGLKDLQLVTGL